MQKSKRRKRLEITNIAVLLARQSLLHVLEAADTKQAAGKTRMILHMRGIASKEFTPSPAAPWGLWHLSQSM